MNDRSSSAENMNTNNLVQLDVLLEDAYKQYAHMVVESRAVPCVLDGLKPVQRRIVYTMYLNNITHTDRYKKSANTVGSVMMNFHPHGNESIYDALVHLVQPFVTRHPLIDGQGNFGSFDDNAAAFRYTECRLSPISKEVIGPIEEHTVPMVPNYDESTVEPQFLSSQIPLLFANGVYGIAVGILTRIPPHNLTELCNAIIAVLNNPNTTVNDIMKHHMPGPDFPTGDFISSSASIKEIYETGQGKLILRAKYHIENDMIVFTSIPFQTSKLNIIEKIKEMIDQKKLPECVWVRDETSKHGVRIVVKVTHSSKAEIMANTILQNTTLKTSYSVICYALDENNQVRIYSLLEYINCFIDFQHKLLIRSAVYKCGKAKARIHVLLGLLTALNNIEDVIAIIKSSDSKDIAAKNLLNREWLIIHQEIIDVLQMRSNITRFSSEQVQGILSMRLQSLVQMGWQDILKEVNQLITAVKEYDNIINNSEQRRQMIEKNLQRIASTYTTKRQSAIESTGHFNERDFVLSKNNLILLTEEQYIKKIDLEEYNLQHRSGVGKQGGKEIILSALMANDRDMILLFTKNGYAYNLDCFKLPISSHGNKGRSIYQVMPRLAEQNDSVLYMQKIAENEKYEYIIFVTDTGYIRKNSASVFTNIRRNGKIYNKSGENIINVILCNESDYIMMASSHGKVTMIPVNAFRTMQQHTSHGIVGCKLNKGDILIKAIAVKENDMVLSILNSGFGRISSVKEYKLYKNRGGKGIANISATSRKQHDTIADIVSIRGEDMSEENASVVITTRSQQTIRIPLNDVKESSRNTRGTKLLNIKEHHDQTDMICFAAVISDEL